MSTSACSWITVSSAWKTVASQSLSFLGICRAGHALQVYSIYSAECSENSGSADLSYILFFLVMGMDPRKLPMLTQPLFCFVLFFLVLFTFLPYCHWNPGPYAC
jgi:hypothetical protein